MKQTILPERLFLCRNNRGLTQSEAAELIGITQPAYQRYEAGVRTPSIQVAKEIAKAFNVSTDSSDLENASGEIPIEPINFIPIK